METSLALYISNIRKQFSKYGDSMLDKYGLTDGTYQYLIFVNKKPGSTAGEMASWFGMDNGHITRCIKRLEKAGYIDREKKEEDKRQVLLYPTEEGKIVFASIQSLMSDWDRLACQSLTGEEKQLLLALLEKVNKSLGEV